MWWLPWSVQCIACDVDTLWVWMMSLTTPWDLWGTMWPGGPSWVTWYVRTGVDLLQDVICTDRCWPAPSYDSTDRYWPAPSCDHIVIWYCADQEQTIILIRTKSSFVSWALSDRLMHFDCCIMINAALHVYYLHFIWLIFCYYWDSYESHSFHKLKIYSASENGSEGIIADASRWRSDAGSRVSSLVIW